MELWGFENNFFFEKRPGAFLQFPLSGPVVKGLPKIAEPPVKGPNKTAIALPSQTRYAPPPHRTTGCIGSAVRQPGSSLFRPGGRFPTRPHIASPRPGTLFDLSQRLGVRAEVIRTLAESGVVFRLAADPASPARVLVNAEAVRQTVHLLAQNSPSLLHGESPVAVRATHLFSLLPVNSDGMVPVSHARVVLEFTQLLTSVARAEPDSREGHLSLLLQVSGTVASVEELPALARNFWMFRSLSPEARAVVREQVARFVSEGHEAVPQAFKRAVEFAWRGPTESLAGSRTCLTQPMVLSERRREQGEGPRDRRQMVQGGEESRRSGEGFRRASTSVYSPIPGGTTVPRLAIGQSPERSPRPALPLIARLGGSAALAELLSLLPLPEQAPWGTFLQQFTQGPAKPAAKISSLSENQRVRMQAFVFRLLQLDAKIAFRAINLLLQAVAHPREGVRMLVLTLLKTLAKSLDPKMFDRLCRFPLVVLARRPRSAPEVQLTAIRVLLDTESGQGRDRRRMETLLEEISLADTLKKILGSGVSAQVAQAFAILSQVWEFLGPAVKEGFRLSAMKMLSNPRLPEQAASAALDFMIARCGLLDRQNRRFALGKPMHLSVLGRVWAANMRGESHVVH